MKAVDDPVERWVVALRRKPDVLHPRRAQEAIGPLLAAA